MELRRNLISGYFDTDFQVAIVENLSVLRMNNFKPRAMLCAREEFRGIDMKREKTTKVEDDNK
jgi:hypothetical protein